MADSGSAMAADAACKPAPLRCPSRSCVRAAALHTLAADASPPLWRRRRRLSRAVFASCERCEARGILSLQNRAPQRPNRAAPTAPIRLRQQQQQQQQRALLQAP